jgi:putative ABC transport system permease protein
MSVIARGIKNTSRNWIRSGAVVFILAIGVGLSLSMLVANQAVNDKIAELKTNMGNTLIISPAGARGFEGGGEPLKNADAESVKNIAHVTSVDIVLPMMLQNQDSDTLGFIRMKNGSGPIKTSLQSAIDPGTLGGRSQQGSSLNASDETGRPVSLPIQGAGITDNKNQSGTELKIIEGTKLAGQENTAVVGKGIAEKNNLHIGSTFTVNDVTVKVVGIFDQGNKFENNGVFVPLVSAQKYTGLNDEVSSIVATVDSIDNLENAQNAIQEKLGKDKADVTSSQANVETAVSSLQSVKTVSVIGFVAALIAAGVITFLIMLVIVRERRREIGVLKAIGGSNRTIVSQFMVEGMVLVALGALVGTGFAVAASQPIASALVASSSSSSSQEPTDGPMIRKGGGPRMMTFGGPLNETTNLVKNVTTQIGITTLLYGLLAAFVIGIVGSALPAWLIAKIRPAEVMRGE